MTNQITQDKLRLTTSLFDLAMQLDGLENLCSGSQKLGKLDAQVQLQFATAISEIRSRHQALSQEINSSLRNQPHHLQYAAQPNTFEDQVPFMNHVGNKLESLQNKYSLGSDPANTMSNVPHSLFVQNTQGPSPIPQISMQPLDPSTQAPIPPAQRNFSFNITTPATLVQKPTQLTLSTALNRISFLLRNKNEAQALEEFKNLPLEVKQSIFGALWIARGKPMPGNPIAHNNFGEVSFFNQEQRCASTPQQKACAVELIKTQLNINEIISLLKEDKFEQAKELFFKLPTQMQNAIYGKHWEACGKPKKGDPLYHWDFGKVSFLGTELHCAVPCAKKAEALAAYLPQFITSFNASQELVPAEIALWKSIDESQTIKGVAKTIEKNKSLHNFSARVIQLFLGADAKIEVLDNMKPETRPQVVAVAYIAKYPFLKPFLLQLDNSLLFQDEKLEDLPVALADAPKSSAKQNPGAMSDKQREQYRLGIMHETLETLNNGYYINSKGQKVTLDLEPAIQSLQLISTNGPPQQIHWAQHNPILCHNPTLFLDNKDCLSVAHDCKLRGLNPVVLDAASDRDFGGGYLKGSGAQEEHLCRTSGLSVAVDPKQGKQQQHFYPLSQHGDTAGLYVSNVPVFRGEEGDGFPYLNEPFETAFAIMPAYNFNVEHQKKNGVQNPPELVENRIPDHLIEGTKGKIRTILYMAETNKHDAVVLVALGCGAFCTPPNHMCELMLDIIIDEFSNSFKEIHIAIINDHNTGKAHNPQGNYAPFKALLEWNEERLKGIPNITFVENP